MVAMIWRGAMVAALLVGGPAGARDLLQPAEIPPVAYSGQQYVDSKGCLFLRAGLDGQIAWIPRVTRDGVPVCGYPPSGNRVPIVGEAATAPPAAAENVAPPAATAKSEETPVTPTANGGILVAVGSFSQAANADRAARAMTSLGLPVVMGKIVRNGVALETVYAGPFDSNAAAGAALKAARGAGYPDAIIMGK
ncbi:SPOR domain-containing protein [Tabrizicola sp.]|uniref:SPOR domain-containing protein n=1 Tax=Tabrizicola sp. TaxID=2005166 RepID=UPI00286AD87F|nr:SPOR domain-containing protein [Tabrizicola sp.]